MSFGFGVGDFVAVGGLCWKVYKKCKDSNGNYAELSSEVSSLYAVIKETEELFSQQELTKAQQAKLVANRQSCEAVLKDLDELLTKYESLGTQSKRNLDRVGFGTKDMYVRAGKREGSVVSTKTFGTVAENDRETWKALRRELEDIGISQDVINEKRQFIVAWFQEAVAAGKLEEDVPADDDYADYEVSCGSNGSVGHASGASSKRSPSPGLVHFESQCNEGQERVTNTESSSGQLVRSPLPQGRRNSTLRISYLVNKLRGKDNQALFLDAVKAEDEQRISYLVNKLRGKDKQALLLDAVKVEDEQVLEKLLWGGINANAKNDTGIPALSIAANMGNERIVKLLLNEGAKIDSTNSYGDTALIKASRAGHEVVVQLLLDSGAHIESQNRDGNTALIEASSRVGNEAVVRLLLDSGAHIDSKNQHGDTALTKAFEVDNEAVMRLLLDSGAHIDSKNHLGDTALIKASEVGNEAAMRLLLDSGAHIDSENHLGDTARTIIKQQCKGYRTRG